MKNLLFSVTAADCEWSYTRGTGNGGQKKNKTNSAVHCMHRPSGAHGYSEASRSQADNKRDAFIKMSETKEFKTWHRIETMKRTGQMAAIDLEVEKQMNQIKIECKKDGKWVDYVEGME
jgi:protein subunit release factor B